MDNIIIFSDGSSRGNPGRGGWGAIVVSDDVRELGGGEKHVTNNQMELKAAIEGLNSVSKSSKDTVTVYTDSSYVINGITKWVHGWQKNNWMTKTKQEVLNRSLWEELIDVSHGKNIEWKYIGGHRGIAGNERCDEIATGFADSLSPKLYSGPLSRYPLNILDFSVDAEKSKKKSGSKSRSKAEAYSYVSRVDGKIKTHKTWAECEKRVKGKSGAKFKKALSEAEEKEIIRGWM